MSNRAFGVEIECLSPYSGAYYDDEDYCCEECSGGDSVNQTQILLENNGFDAWAELTTDDCSLPYNGVEIKSPPLVGVEGFKELKKVFTLLNNNGFDVDESCGMHVHHDAPDFLEDFSLIERLVKSWMENQEVIDTMVDPYRVNNDHCEPWEEYDYNEIVSKQSWNYGPRGALNISSLEYHGTIEIRQHEGTLNYEEAESWIKFGQSFIDSVRGRKNPIPKLSDEELLLKRIKVAKNASKFLSTKAKRNKRRPVSSRYW